MKTYVKNSPAGVAAVVAATSLALLVNCQSPNKVGDASVDTSAAQKADAKSDVVEGPCGDYATKVCKEIGDATGECASIKAATKMMPPAACTAGMKDIAYTVNKYQKARVTCVELTDKLCKDLGEETKTCKMVREKTGMFPPDRCKQMMSQYDNVIKELKTMEERNKPLTSEKAKAIAAGDGVPSFGPSNAKVTVVEFSDFECPYCSKAADAVNEVKKKFKGKSVRFVFRQFPLSFHKNADLAAQASLAAHEQNKFWAMHDKMFANYRKLDRESIEGYAKELKLNMKKFKKALDNKTYAQDVQNDLKLGETAAVSGTPAMFINGERVDNPTDFEAIEKLINAQLNKSLAKK